MKIRHLWAVLLLSIPVFSMEGEENLLLRQLSDGFNELLEADDLTRENFLALMEKNRLLAEENQRLKEQVSYYQNQGAFYDERDLLALHGPEKKRKREHGLIGPIPDNVVKFPQPLYNQIDHELKEKFGDSHIFVSPSKPKSTIKNGTFNVYSMTAVLDAKDAYIEPEARIDASTLVKGDITDQNLNEALWNAEKSLLEIISFDSSIVHQAVYVGATKRSLGDRASEHFSCLRESLKKEQVMSPLKEQVLVRALLSGYHVRISRIIFNIPPKREGVFEVLVTYLLLAQESGGSAVSATAAARQQFADYMKSNFRQEKLTHDEKFFLLTQMHEDLAKKQFIGKINPRKLTFQEEN